MKVSKQNIIAQNIDISESNQSVEFIPLMDSIGHSSIMTGMIMSLLMTCFSSTPAADIVQQKSYSVPEEVILHYVRTVPTELNVNKTRLNNILDQIRTMQNGWGSGGLPIALPAIDFSKRIIAHCSDVELEHWNISPYINGTVMMHYRGEEGKHSSINIGKSTVSAFKTIGASYEAFQKPADECFEEVLGIIRSLNS